MEVKIRTIAITVLAVGMLGYATGRYVQPAKVETKIVTQVQTVEVVHNNVQTVTREVDRPDGTKEKITTVTDKSTENSSSSSTITSDKIKENEKPQWIVGAQLTPSQGLLGPVYGAEVQRRILGPIFAGAFANTDKTVGLSVSLEF